MTMEVNFTHAYAHSFISVSSGFCIQNFTCSIPSCATLIKFLMSALVTRIHVHFITNGKVKHKCSSTRTDKHFLGVVSVICVAPTLQ